MDNKYLNLLIERYPQLDSAGESIFAAYQALQKCFSTGGKLLVAGNGGSCADAEHIVGELMKGFKLRRELSDELKTALRDIDEEQGALLADSLQGALPAIALTNHTALNTAFLNDVNGDMAVAQQVLGYGQQGDVFLGISTSGNAKNINYAAITAKAIGITVIGLTGEAGGRLSANADIMIKVKETETYMIQELHLPVYHTLCLMLEDRFFGTGK